MPDRRWTVTTWNLQGAKPTDLSMVADVLTERSPDVVLLQEVRRPQAEELAERLLHRWVWHFKHHPWRPLWADRAEGAAVLTPHQLGGTGHEVISDATSRRSWRRRIVVWATVSRPSGALRVLNVHLSPHDLRAERLAEADRIAALAARLGPRPPIVLGGDLNDHGEPETLARLPGVEHVPSPPTNPAHRPTQVLDHVMVPEWAEEVTLESPPGGDRWLPVSDHLPVTVRFSLPGDHDPPA